MDSNWKLCLLLMIFLSTCIHEGLCIKCWDCRSDFDPYCEDPFDNSTFAITDCNFLPDLPHLPGVRPTMCRKMRQKVNGQWKILRGCAYLGEPGVGENEKLCLARTGDDIIAEYCTCNSRDGCNSGPMLYSNQLAVLFAAFIAYFMAPFYNQ